MKSIILSIISLAIIVAIFFVFLDYATTIPDVEFSNSTGACVYVQNYPAILFENPIYTCENLPTKYNHIWVK
jgi:hypothetical protein